jgi:hypothetical protein
MAYLTPTMPPLGKLHSAFICIADKQGGILDRVTFDPLFRRQPERPDLFY